MSSPKSMAPVAGCLACLAGIVWQWPTEAEGRPSLQQSPFSNRNQSGLVSTASSITPSSSRPRTLSKRHRIFPFDGLIPGSAEASFLRLRPDLAEKVEKRREKAALKVELQCGGLGRKHPDLLKLKKAIAELEEEILRDWDLSRPRRRIER